MPDQNDFVAGLFMLPSTPETFETINTKPVETVEVPGEWNVKWKVHLPSISPQSISGVATNVTSSPYPSSTKTEQNIAVSSPILDDSDHPDFDENDRWPRRLLDVSTMTSYKWQPGNVYGGVAEPFYSVLSYTWGRWRIRGSHSGVKSLEIQGVPWEIPKVDPKHFTAEQFKNTLQLMVDTSNRQNRIRHRSSNFVWLDIACIPQSQQSAIAASEVGRQARIFRNADIGYVWLTTAAAREVEKLCDRAMTDTPTEMAEHFQSFCKILADPWFRSMWTLQESFIRRDAYILTTARLCFRDRYGFLPLSLSRLRDVADEDLTRHKHHNGFGVEAEPHFTSFEQIWSQAGIQEPRTNSPMQVLASARFRTCEVELDRVYAIMQIFGDEIKVGKARALTDGERAAAQSWTLLTLEDELGALLLKHFPLMSQLFCHDEPPLPGKAWRICGRSTVPYRFGHASLALDTRFPGVKKDDTRLFPEPDCVLSFSPSTESLTWATFNGRVCRFDRVVECSKSEHFTPPSSWMNVYLDAGPDCSNFDGSDVDGIFKYFDPETLMVLSLSPPLGTQDPSHTFRWAGMLLMSPGEAALSCHQTRRQWQRSLDHVGRQAWARVGLCLLDWNEPDTGRMDRTRSEVRTLLGASEDWQLQQGFWG